MFTVLLSCLVSWAHADGLTMAEFLESAWEQSPSARGEAHRNEASEYFVSAARAKYLPRLSIDAIDSTGFPASNSRLGVSGIMASPFRSGFSGGVVLEQTLFDFGRIRSALRAAHAEKSLDEARAAEEKLRFLLEAGQIYIRCAKSRSTQQLDEKLLKWGEIVARESAHFTRTGQRSIVDNALIQTEVDNLRLELDGLSSTRQSLREQMQILGVSGDCQALTSTQELKPSDHLRVAEPSQLLAQAQIDLARAELAARRAD